jgi:hypothetical protein
MGRRLSAFRRNSVERLTTTIEAMLDRLCAHFESKSI